tara:strand:- start:45 stop:1016 length:972 start_codon:yes stop_codon:yes gene_type:complete
MRFDSRGLVSTYLSQWMPTGDTTRQAVAGYFAGGNGGSNTSRVDTLIFSSETITNLGNILLAAYGNLAAHANSGVAGYVTGFYDSSVGDFVSTGNKIAFPSNTTSVIAGMNPITAYGRAGFANSGVAGYVGGGQAGGTRDVINKLLYSADTTTTLSATLTTGIYYGGAFSNSGVAGYFTDGFDGTTSRVDKITFSADTKSVISATLTSGIVYTSGMSDYGVGGYVVGGTPDGGSTKLSRIDKITFPADTKTTLSATLTTARWQTGNSSNTGVAGYMGGGSDSGGFIDGIDKITFPTDTKSTLSAVLSYARTGATGAFSDCGVL